MRELLDSELMKIILYSLLTLLLATPPQSTINGPARIPGPTTLSASSTCTPSWVASGSVNGNAVFWTSGTTIVFTFNSAPVAGMHLNAAIAVYNGTASPPTITSVVLSGSSQSFTASPQSPYSGAGTNVQTMALYDLNTVTSGATSTVTVTFGSTPTAGGIQVQAYTDGNSCSQSITEATPATGTASSITTPSATASAGSLVISFVCSHTSVSSLNSPFTALASNLGGVGCLVGYDASATGSIAANATNGSNTNYNSMLELIQ
jgi:hypothetical protein